MLAHNVGMSAPMPQPPREPLQALEGSLANIDVEDLMNHDREEELRHDRQRL